MIKVEIPIYVTCKQFHIHVVQVRYESEFSQI